MNSEPDPKQYNVNVNDADAIGWTLLHHAANEGRKEVIAFLLDHGASVNMADNSGNTALHYAASHNYCPTVRILLAHGAQVTVRNKCGMTPLDLAISDAANILKQHQSPKN